MVLKCGYFISNHMNIQTAKTRNQFKIFGSSIINDLYATACR